MNSEIVILLFLDSYRNDELCRGTWEMSFWQHRLWLELPAGVCGERCSSRSRLFSCTYVTFAAWELQGGACSIWSHTEVLQPQTLRALVLNCGFKICWCEDEKQIVSLETKMKSGAKSASEPVLCCSHLLLHTNKSFRLWTVRNRNVKYV